VNFDSQIPKKAISARWKPGSASETYAAGLALESAGVKGNKEILGGWT